MIIHLLMPLVRVEVHEARGYRKLVLLLEETDPSLELVKAPDAMELHQSVRLCRECTTIQEQNIKRLYIIFKQVFISTLVESLIPMAKRNRRV